MSFTMLGIDDEVTTCDCCGKTRLKCTVALSKLDADGIEVAVVRYGRDCAAKALGLAVTANKIEQKARAKTSVDLSAGMDTARKLGTRREVRHDSLSRYGVLGHTRDMPDGRLHFQTFRAVNAATVSIWLPGFCWRQINSIHFIGTKQ